MTSEKKYSVIFFRKELEKLKILHDTVNFQNLVYHFKSPTINIDFNDFIDVEKIRFEDAGKKKLNEISIETK